MTNREHISQVTREVLLERYDRALQQYFADLEQLQMSEAYLWAFEDELDRREKESE